MRTSYGQRDYTFGQAILTLRVAIGLTQAELAKRLCVSRRAVVEWEVGSSYPKVEHLKELIALAVKSQAFTAGRETEEIRSFWKAAHQRVLLDELWLSALLSERYSSHLRVVPPDRAAHDSTAVGTRGPAAVGTHDPTAAGAHDPTAISTRGPTAAGTRDSTAAGTRGPAVATGLAPVEETMRNASDEPLSVPDLRVDWGDAPAIPVFYGREEELTQLTQWVVQEHCRVISVLGMGGIGKSALSIRLMYRLAVGTAACPCPFEVVIFRSLRDAPSCEALLDECLQVLSLDPPSVGTGLAPVWGPTPSLDPPSAGTGLAPVRGPAPISIEQRMSLLLSHFRKTRVLVVLDNLESLLKTGDVKGHLRPGFEGYGELLHRVAETAHQSCLLFTSWEKLAELRRLEGKRSQVRSLRLTGMDVTACKQLLEEQGLVGSQEEQEQFIEAYGGNPLALKMMAETIVDLFGGEIGPFLAEGIVLFGSINDLLAEQFARLSDLERSVLCSLAIVREPMTIDELLAVQVFPLSRIQMLEAVDAAYRRSLIERGKRPGSFTLQSVVREYVTAVLIAKATDTNL